MSVPHPAKRREALEAQYPEWQRRTLSQALDASVRRYASRPLVITQEREYTYQEIQDWSRSIAAGLVAAGVAPGDHVAMIMANHPEFVALKYAIARIGAVAVPLNYLLRQNELLYILEQSDASVLVTMDALRDRDYLSDLDQMIPGWQQHGGGDRLPRLRHVFVHFTREASHPSARTLTDLQALAGDADRDEVLAREDCGDPGDYSDIIYTSGTTGLPKGVMLGHDQVLRTAYACAYTRAFEDGRRILFSLPMYHVFGYVECLVASTFVGGAIIPHVVFDPEAMVLAAERHKASEIVCVPMMTMKLIEVVRARGGFDGSRLVAMFNSGGMTPPSLWQEIRDLLQAREVLTAYGMSETTASTTCTIPEGPDALLLTTNGRFKAAGVAGDPALGGMLAIYKTIDPETGEDLAPGEFGELVARGPIITRGYYNKPEETAAAFTADGWLHTGDLGVVDAEGNLTLTGRIKETYRCGGEMVMPKEVEDVVSTHPLVEQALVVGIPDTKMGEIGCICVVAAATGTPDPGELIELCAQRLARFKVPRHVLFLAPHEIPLTATGRPQKFKLADLVKERLSGTTRSAAPA